MASQNEFDTFDYLKPADYLPSLQQRYSEQNQGFEDAEQVAKMNDRQRVANAEIMGKVIKNAESFSKSAAKVFKKQRDHTQKLYKNEAFDLQLAIGANQADYHKYKTEREALGEDHSIAQYLAQKALESGQNDFSRDLQNITGWRAQIHEETLGMRWANNLEPNFWDQDIGILAKDENGNYKVTLPVKGDPGQPDKLIDWTTANIAQKQALMQEWKVQTGYTGVSHYRKEFAVDTFVSKLRAFEKKIIDGENTKDKEAQKLERVNGYKETLIEAAKYGDGRLAKYLHELERTELGHWEGDRSKLRKDLIDLLGRMYVDGDIELDDLTLEGYTFFHTGNNREEPLSVFNEYEVDFANMKRDAIAKKTAREKKDIDVFGTTFTERTKTGLEESGEQLTEATLGQVKQTFDQEFMAEFGRLPTAQDYPPELINMLTVEDQNDADIESILEDKKIRGEEIKYQDYARLYDQKKFKTWSDYAKSARGQGLSEKALGHRKDNVERIVQEQLNTTLGYHDFKNREHGYLLDRATAQWNVIYSDGIDEVDLSIPGAEAKFLREVDDRLAIQLEKWANQPPEPRTARTFKYEIKQSETFIKNATENGQTVREALTAGLIPGSESHYARLEKYAATPGSQLPQYYHEIAARTGISPWQAANLQWQVENPGKELPKPGWQKRQESKPPVVNYLNQRYSNRNRARRGMIIQTGADVNDESLITPGLIPMEVV